MARIKTMEKSKKDQHPMVDPTTRKAPAKKAKIIPSRSQAKVSNDTNVSSSRAPHPSVGFSGKLST